MIGLLIDEEKQYHYLIILNKSKFIVYLFLCFFYYSKNKLYKNEKTKTITFTKNHSYYLNFFHYKFCLVIKMDCMYQ